MENPKQWRDNMAEELKAIPSHEERRKRLDEIKSTDEYKISKDLKKQAKENVLGTENEAGTGNQIEKLSSKTASEKLALIKEGFYEYAVRFSTLRELEEIIETQKIKPREAFVPKLDDFEDLRLPSGAGGKFEYKHPLSFDEYITKKGNGGTWKETAWMQTEWQPSLGQISAHELLLSLVKMDHKRYDDETANSREVTLTDFRDRILRLVHTESKKRPEAFQKEFDEEGGTTWLEILQELIELKTLLSKLRGSSNTDALVALYEESRSIETSNKKEVTSLRELLRDTIDPLKDTRSFAKRRAVSFDNLIVLSDFIDNPDYIQEAGNLRKIIDALSNSLITTTPPYQLAMFFSENSVSSRSTYHNSWRITKDEKDNPDQAGGLLAVVAVISDKNLLGKISELSKQGGKFACPVFSADGNLVFPKQETE